MNPTLRWNSTGTTLLGVAGINGTTSNLLHWPYGLAFDSSNNLYIVDTGNNRVQKLISGTSMAVTVIGYANGTAGPGMDQLASPIGIFFDSNENIYVADRGNDRIQFYTKGTTSGSTVAGKNSDF